MSSSAPNCYFPYRIFLLPPSQGRCLPLYYTYYSYYKYILFMYLYITIYYTYITIMYFTSQNNPLLFISISNLSEILLSTCFENMEKAFVIIFSYPNVMEVVCLPSPYSCGSSHRMFKKSCLNLWNFYHLRTFTISVHRFTISILVWKLPQSVL